MRIKTFVAEPELNSGDQSITCDYGGTDGLFNEWVESQYDSHINKIYSFQKNIVPPYEILTVMYSVKKE